jgi:hypothetical protein
MKRYLLLVILTYWATLVRGQVIDQRIEIFTRDLKLDTFLIYSFPCSGGMSFDSCATEETHYLFWVQNGKYYVKKFEYCHVFQSVIIDTSGILPFYFSNAHIIDKETIKPPTYYKIRKSKTGFDTLRMSSFVDHSCYHELSFHIKNRIVRKTVDIYDLDFAKFDSGERNIYYRYNQRTKLKALIDKIVPLTKLLNVNSSR